MSQPTRDPRGRRSTTGHELGDRMVPAALQLVDAVRRGSRRDAHDAIATAQRAAGGYPYWVFALVCTLAALVPDDQPLSDLLAWVQPGHSPDLTVTMPLPPSRKGPAHAPHDARVRQHDETS